MSEEAVHDVVRRVLEEVEAREASPPPRVKGFSILRLFGWQVG